MRYFRLLSCSLLCSVASVAGAESLDDAVTLYLKGFEHCSSAKSALSDNQLDKALKAFAEYESVKEQAAKIDPSILSTSQRGMDSNLKYCIRVGTDIEVAQGTPLLEQSLVQCDKAFEAYKQGDAVAANQFYRDYVQGRDQALAVAPSLTGVFSLKSEIRRCDRLDSKIANAGKQQAELSTLLESAREESDAFSSTCNAAQKEFQSASLNAQTIQSAEKALGKAEQYKRNANDAYTQYLAKQAGPEKANDGQVDKQIKSGNQCLTAFSSALTAQKTQLSRLTGELKQSAKQLDVANQQCGGIASLSAQGADRARYEQGKSRFESARKSRDSVRSSLASNTYYQGNAESPDVRELNQQLDKLNRCLDAARGQVAALMPAQPVAVAIPTPVATPKAPKAEKLKTEKAGKTAPASTPQVASVPAIRLSATLVMSGLTPEFVLVYWADGTRAQPDRDAEIFSTGFGKKLYILSEDGSLQFKNADFGNHAISVVNPLQGIDQSLANISSRQNRNTKIMIPPNSLAMLRSNRERVEPSFVVNGVSNHQLMLKFSDEAQSLSIELDNPQGARQLVVLMPDTDPLMVDVVGGDEKNVTLTRDKVAVGSLSVRGL